MKIYYHGRSENHTLHVMPGVDYPEKPEWRETDGRFKAFEIRFVNHTADVEDNLGHYLVKKGLASKSPIHTPYSNEAA